MENENEILRLVREKVGLNMTKSADYEVLSQAIKETTNEQLGINTLKRMFGFKMNKVVPRQSTMDIIAKYLGSEDYDALLRKLGDSADISLFTPIDCIEVSDLDRGMQVKVTYEPGRVLFLTYLGDQTFIVNNVEGSQGISKGDLLKISQLVVGHRLVVLSVVRDDENLGSYEAAKYQGIKSVEVIR